MTDQQIEELVRQEFKLKTLSLTEQYLEIHEPIYEAGVIKIDRIDREKVGNRIIAYLPVKDEYFSFAVYIDEAESKITSIGTESKNTVRLKITSNTMTAKEILMSINLKYTNCWNKGDKKNNGREYKFSCIEFEPNPEPDKFEDKLSKLLSYLETDKTGIIKLVSTTDAHAYIQVVMDFHRGNQLLGGLTLNFDSIKRIYDLRLELDFDFTAWGNPFK